MSSATDMVLGGGHGRPLAVPLVSWSGVGAGAAAVVAGSLLPWVTLFRGLTTVSGIGADGFFLVGLAVGVGLLLAWYERLGRPASVRRLAAALATAIVAVSGLDWWRIAHFVGNPGAVAPLVAPSAGPGPVVTFSGGLLLLTAILVMRPGAGRLPRGTWPRVALAGSLAVAAWIHFDIVGEHLGQTLLLGLGTAGFGVAQAVLAVLLLARPRRWALDLVVAVDAALVFFYAFNVLVGLPFAKPEPFSPGLLLGQGEAVGLRGAVALICEISGMGAAIWLRGSAAQERPASEAVSTQLARNLGGEGHARQGT
jgi:hypothetical protein